MILNLLRVNDLSVEDMIKRSFSEFHTQRALSGHNLKEKLIKSEANLAILVAEQQQEECILGEIPEIEDYVFSFNTTQTSMFEQLKYIYLKKQQDLSTILCPGRLICIQKEELICPVSGIVIAEPFAEKDATSSSNISAISTARTALTISHDLTGSVSSSVVDTPISNLYIWVALILPNGVEPPTVINSKDTLVSTSHTISAVKPTATTMRKSLLSGSTTSSANKVIKYNESSGKMMNLSSNTDTYNENNYWFVKISLSNIAMIGNKKLNITEDISNLQDNFNVCLYNILNYLQKETFSYNNNGILIDQLDLVKETKIFDIDFVTIQR